MFVRLFSSATVRGAMCALLALVALAPSPSSDGGGPPAGDARPVATPVATGTAGLPGGMIVLSLRPGVRPPCHFKPFLPVPRDITPRPVTVTVPLYPGANVRTEPFLQAHFGGPAIPYLKTGCAEYVLPADVDTADAWYRRAFARLGYILDGQGSGSGPTTAAYFASKGAMGPAVQLFYEPTPDGRTLALYFAYVVAVPPRPPGSYLPANIARVRVSYRMHDWTGMYNIALTRTITDHASVASLVTAINGLSRGNEGLHTCPAIRRDERATLLFDERGGESVTVLYSGSVYGLGVVVAASPPLVDDGRVRAILARLLHLPPLSSYPPPRSSTPPVAARGGADAAPTSAPALAATVGAPDPDGAITLSLRQDARAPCFVEYSGVATRRRPAVINCGYAHIAAARRRAARPDRRRRHRVGRARGAAGRRGRVRPPAQHV